MPPRKPVPSPAVEASGDKEARLAAALANIEKTYGKGTVVLVGDAEDSEVERIPTGIPSLDHALSGGFPRGKIVEIMGENASGKTSIALHAAGSVIRSGGKVAYVDTEYAVDRSQAELMGLDFDQIFLSQPGMAEDAFSIVEHLAKTGSFDLIVVDSTAALTPRAEIEGDFGSAHVGLLARLMSQACRKLVGIVANNNTCLVFISQLRTDLKVIYGDPMKPTGGKALEFYSSLRLRCRRSNLKKGDVIVGSTIKVKVEKSKISKPYVTAEFNITENGVDCIGPVLDAAEEMGLIEKKGSWYRYGEQKWQGTSVDPEVYAQIEKLVLGG